MKTKTSPTQIHVSPVGKPGAKGGPESPATLEEIPDRLLSAGEPTEVLLHGGHYLLKDTLRFSHSHSAAPQQPHRLMNASGTDPVISGAHPVRGWKKLDHTLPGFSEETAENVWYSEVGKGFFRVLYHAGKLLQRARYGPFTSDPERDDEATDTVLSARKKDLLEWDIAMGMELFISPEHVWQAQYLPIAEIDRDRGRIRTEIPGTYRLIASGKTREPGMFYWIENVPEGLLAPGQWLLDARSGRLYLWPVEAGEPRDISYPAITELLCFGGSDQEPCRHFELRGLTFAHGDRLPWPGERLACQHDWQIYDWPDAMVRLKHTRNIEVHHCKFRDSGGTGIRLDGGAVHNRVEHCHFEQLGSNAIAIVGSPPGGREISHHNTLKANIIQSIGELLWQASGIFLNQSGSNRICDNKLFRLPYAGIVITSGREGIFGVETIEGKDGKGISAESFAPSPPDWFYSIGHLDSRHNRIEFNEIFDVMRKLGDGNGIYISGAGWGNVIKGNFVHDLPGAGTNAAIRTDDFQWYTRVEANVVCRINGGGILLKDINDITDNVIVHCFRMGSIGMRRTPSWGANVKRNILVQNPMNEEGEKPPLPFYFGGGFGGEIEEPNTDDNVLWCPDQPSLAESCLKAMRELGRDLKSIASDPKFVDGDNDDFRLQPDSPAWDLGFCPPTHWGVREEPGSHSKTPS